MLIKNTPDDILKLRQRYHVENTFCQMKKRDILGYIYTKKIKYFEGFVYMIGILMNI